MAGIICIFAVFIIPVNVVEILALDIKNRCPTYEQVGAVDVDMNKYGGTWYDFIHSGVLYTCALEVHSEFRKSSSYYFKLDYVSRAFNGSVYEVHDVSFPSSPIAKGYSGYDHGTKYMNAFLDTVYDNYSIEFGCEESSAGPQIILYAITRSVKNEDFVLQKAKEFNKKLGLGLEIKTYPNQCKGLKLR